VNDGARSCISAHVMVEIGTAHHVLRERTEHVPRVSLAISLDRVTGGTSLHKAVMPTDKCLSISFAPHILAHQ